MKDVLDQSKRQGRTTMTTTSNGDKQKLTCEKLESLGFKRKSYSKRLDMFVLDDGVLCKIVLKKFVKDDSWKAALEGTDADMNTRHLTVSGGLMFEDDLRRCAETVGISIEKLSGKFV